MAGDQYAYYIFFLHNCFNEMITNYEWFYKHLKWTVLSWSYSTCRFVSFHQKRGLWFNIRRSREGLCVIWTLLEKGEGESEKWRKYVGGYVLMVPKWFTELTVGKQNFVNVVWRYENMIIEEISFECKRLMIKSLYLVQ